MIVDEGTEFGARVARRLREERIVWLTTVTPAGAPVPSPVWFLWDGEGSVLMFSRDGTPRVRNIQANPRVSLSFDGDGNGGDIVVLSGAAVADRAAPAAHEVPGYVSKYEWGFIRLGTTAAEFAEQYPVPVRVRLIRLRGH